jgi:hypothetical protein
MAGRTMVGRDQRPRWAVCVGRGPAWAASTGCRWAAYLLIFFKFLNLFYFILAVYYIYFGYFSLFSCENNLNIYIVYLLFTDILVIVIFLWFDYFTMALVILLCIFGVCGGLNPP